MKKKAYAVVLLLILGGIIMYERVNWQNSPSTATPVSADNLNKMDMGIADIDSQLAENVQKFAVINEKLENNANDILGAFLRSLETGEITNIKIIGDSISVGVGSTGGEEDPAGTIILTMIDETVKREARTTSPCWANFFRNYIADKYPDVDFFNAGIGGWSVKTEGTIYADDWIGVNNDVVFVMLGTNDRSDCATELEFETALQSFLTQVKDNCNTMIVLTAPPTLNDFDASGNKSAGLNLTMEQIDKVITNVCIKNSWDHISFYRYFLDYFSVTQIPFELLLQSDGGSHPTNAGYLLMWKYFQSKLGVLDNTYEWQTNLIDPYKTRISNSSGSAINNSTPITDFTKNQITMHLISGGHSDIANYPEAKGGTLTTIRPYSDSYAWQEYNIIFSNSVYRRYWQSGAWTTWKRISGNVSLPTTVRTALTSRTKGDMIFDETLGKPVWFDGTNWVDATGANVD